jgi:hypothetical protein
MPHLSQKLKTMANSSIICNFENMKRSAWDPMQAFGRNQISVQVSGFRIWGLLTPDTYNPIPDDSSGFTLTTHLRILRGSYDLRL